MSYQKFTLRVREPTRFKAVVKERKKFTAKLSSTVVYVYLGGVVLSQAAYDSLLVKDPDTYYFIMG